MTGPLVLERQIDSIQIGKSRYREELGDLTELVASILRIGLLQPVVITPSGVLVCGLRRLRACELAGMRAIKVTVNAHISTRLEELLAELHENTLRKDYTTREQAALYAELKEIEQEEAAKRKALTQFGGPLELASGPGAAPGPGRGEARELAARAITGHDSSQTHERVLAMEALAADESQPPWLREQARIAVESLDQGGKAKPLYRHLHALDLAEQLQKLSADPSAPEESRHVAERAVADIRDKRDDKARILLAQQALKVLAEAKRNAKVQPIRAWADSDERVRQLLPVRHFIDALTASHRWWEDFDPAAVAAGLAPEHWRALQDYAGSLHVFVGAVGRIKEAS